MYVICESKTMTNVLRIPTEVNTETNAISRADAADLEAEHRQYLIARSGWFGLALSETEAPERLSALEHVGGQCDLPEDKRSNIVAIALNDMIEEGKITLRPDRTNGQLTLETSLGLPEQQAGSHES